MRHNDLSFWLMIIAIIAHASGTVIWSVWGFFTLVITGILIVALRSEAKREGRAAQRQWSMSSPTKGTSR
jgi:hypothetical protein